jgi:anti-sigma regulatory factor (Ser/Thr protein kinase)/GNAT superfamily N-acetyltransferase
MEAHLYLEAKLPMVGSVTDFTYKWCVNMGLDQTEAARMALAVDEILTDIVLYAFREETGYAEIWYQYTFSEIEIIIQEKGEPFDPEKHVYSSEKAIRENDFEGASFECVRKMTDHFLFLNRGKDGKEFRLVKQFFSKDIRDRLPEIAETEEADQDISEDDNYLLTPVTSEDAEDIAKLIYRSYGYSYSKEDLYFPRRIEMAIRHEYKFGTIVRTMSGGPAGYFAVVKSTDSLIGEIGEAVVSPHHRKRGLMKRMLNKLIEMSRQRGLIGLFGEALTVHTYSQKVNEKFGFKSTAMVLAKSPRRIFKGMDTESADIVSVVIDFLPLTKRWRKPDSLPDTYKDLLTDIYSQFEHQSVESSSLITTKTASEITDINLTIYYEKYSALIIVRDVGATFEASCSRMLRSIGELKLASVYVDLPLNDKRTNSAIIWLKERGFIFAGLMPMFHRQSDYLRLQRIDADVDFDRILTHSEISTRIKEVIKHEYAANNKEQAEA